MWNIGGEEVQVHVQLQGDNAVVDRVLDETDHGLAFSSSMCIKTLVKKQGGKSSVRVRVGLTGR